jgi:hypothetical protein
MSSPASSLHAAALAGATAALLAATSVAAQAPARPVPCSAPESRQFDFWIGDWDVFTPDGKPAGTNRIAPLYGCVLHESWKGNGGFEGQSFNRWDGARRVWHQTWVDGGGTLLVIEGAFADGVMRLSDANQPGKKDPLQVNEIAWSRNADASVRQHWRTSADGGRTWTTAFDGKYVRSARPQPEVPPPVKPAS